jgi:hypothetical protein
MTAAGRPLRFLVALATVWVGVRAAQLWPEAARLPTLVAATAAPPVALAAYEIPVASIVTQPAAVIAAAFAPPVGGTARTRLPHDVRSRTAAFVAAPAAAQVTPSEASEPLPQGAIVHPAIRAPLTAAVPPRLAGSGWMIVRGGGNATPFAPQLGGSQAGLRLTYAIDGARRLALAGRVSSALGTRQREAAIGLDWRPTALPVHIVAEQRISIDGTRGGPALGLIGGIGPTPIVGNLRLDAYAQGGAIARDGVEGFVDGAIRLAQPVAMIGPARLDIGIGAWGGAQRGAARLDAGPAASVALPLAGRAVRLSVECGIM